MLYNLLTKLLRNISEIKAPTKLTVKTKIGGLRKGYCNRISLTWEIPQQTSSSEATLRAVHRIAFLHKMNEEYIICICLLDVDLVHS
jgi:hypothetical protein